MEILLFISLWQEFKYRKTAYYQYLFYNEPSQPILRAEINYSGFARMFYHVLGIQLPQFALLQSKMGRYVPPNPKKLQYGDLIFSGGDDKDYYFDNSEAGISHVAVVLDQEHVSHASANAGRVFIESLARYLKRLRSDGKHHVIRRILPDNTPEKPLSDYITVVVSEREPQKLRFENSQEIYL